MKASVPWFLDVRISSFRPNRGKKTRKWEKCDILCHLLYLWSICGPFMIYLWPIYGLYRSIYGYILSIYGPSILHLWSIYGLSMVNIGLSMVHLWSIYGPSMVYLWSIYGIYRSIYGLCRSICGLSMVYL